MKQQLQETSIFHCVRARGMYKSLYIFLLMICGAAYGQPTMISPIPSGSKNFIYVNGNLYYSNGTSLYQGTATSAPTLVANTGESILRIYEITLGSNFFFVTQGGSGERLWRSDGTAANTVQVTTATQIIPLLVYNGQLFMRVNATDTGVELWKVDGAYNASIVKDINPGVGNGLGFGGSLVAIHNNLLYLLASDGTETNLWKSDGTTAGTELSADFDDDTEVYNASEFYGLTSYNNALYFTRNHEESEWGDRIAELWKSDGTTEGTAIMVAYTQGYSYNYLSHFIVFEGKLYFFHGIGDPAYVWFSVTDGTAEGTQHLELVTIDGDPLKLIDGGSYLLYYAHSQSFTTPLMKHDGTTETTVHEFSMYHSSTSGEVIDLTYTGGRAFFLDYIERYNWPQTESQLFQADLASGVTRPVQEIYEGSSVYNSANITAADGSIFFTRLVSNEMTLWYYDPSASPPSCEGTGNIFQEIWTNVPGTDVKAFDFSSPPTGTSRSFTSFETSQYYANNYASRMRGTICVPQTGLYTFWISSDDQSELYLSTDPTEENANLIASVYGHTPFRNYDKYPSQKSRQIYLEADRKYYIEARHKEGSGNDFISVGWQLPDGTMQRPIPGSRLSAITAPPNQAPFITITSPQQNQSFPASSSVTIAADVTDPDGVYSVRFTRIFPNGSSGIASFAAPPYEYQWDNIPPGDYQILVTASDIKGAESTETIFFTVEDLPCTGTGTMVREIWTGIPGTSISSIPVNSQPPSNRQTLTSLSTQNYYANDYGSRIRGYLCIPTSGVYWFWISGDDNSELWLSTDDNPANKTRIAYAATATKVNEWNKYASQQSVGITLIQGRRYYIEVLHKEANGADHVEVGWQLPSGTMERPIPGNHLIPFDPATTAAQFATEQIFSAEEETTFAVYPNPVGSGKQIALRLPVATDGNVDVDIKSITGVSVQNETLSAADGEVLIDLKPSISTGMYLIRVSNQKGRWHTKLQVK
jgi:ELWxxDGT repeat protein